MMTICLPWRVYDLVVAFPQIVTHRLREHLEP
ncbi:MAG: hypothetical protein KatS3mg110_0443 [Pirellulaceae bacterium]|nr:MAG: hypothetical protein KatS3mg110_0443 [Pirellulaceae bacterium]